MVQAVALAHNAAGVHAVQVGKLMQHAARRVADAVGKVISHVAQRLRDDARGVGEVKDLDRGLGQTLDALAVVRQGGHRAHSKRQAGSARGLLAQDTQVQRDALVAHAGVVAADTDGRDDIVGVAYRLVGVGGQRELERRVEQARHVARQAAVDAQLVRVAVHEHELCDVQVVCALCDALCQEHGADAAAPDNRQLH